MKHDTKTLSEVSSLTYSDEKNAVDKLIAATKLDSTSWARIYERATRYAEAIRNSSSHGIEKFIQEYSLSSQEGVAIMCLAESLLRIPDTKTAKALIEDKLKNKKWAEHAGKSSSTFVNASTWGLILTGKIVDMSDSHSWLPKLLNRMGEPLVLESIKQGIKYISNEFILGEDFEEALTNSSKYRKLGYNFSFDILGESSRTREQANFYYQEYLKAIAIISKVTSNHKFYNKINLSVKLTALHPKVLLCQEARLDRELMPKLLEICKLCSQHNITISFDSEESYRQDIYFKILEKLVRHKDLASFQGLGFVLQAYSKRTYHLIDLIANLARDVKKKIPIRLVKGSYWDSEIKYAQENGLPNYPVFTAKEHTDISYMACAQKLFSYKNFIYPEFATHNAQTAAAVIEFAGDADFELQRSQGMGQGLYNELLKDGYKACIYAPVGKHPGLLAYLVGRLIENSANSSFANLIGDYTIPLSKVLEDPITAYKNRNLESLLLPAQIYEGMVRSTGLELGVSNHFALITENLAKFIGKKYTAYSILKGKNHAGGREREIYRPAQLDEGIGISVKLDASHLNSVLDSVAEYFSKWSQYPVQTRAAIIRKFADLMEANKFEIYHLLIIESGKNINDAISELRRAVDFARYYAQKAEELCSPLNLPSCTGEKSQLTCYPKGVFVCISPWNFPLAIFIGQVIAALVTGNTVIAKPADNTPLIAAYITNLLLEAGLPSEALSLVLCGGKELSEAILSDNQVSGVCFTGSTEVAHSINRILAMRNAPIASFIAETSGQNAMIVDSSAPLEQAVDAIVTSAFGATGQRCSSLRVLYVQEEIYEPLLELIKGATEQLTIGDTMDFSIDLGPVIDKASLNSLNNHIRAYSHDKVGDKGEILFRHPQDLSKLNGYFIRPAIIRIKKIADLEKEHFGPILHIIKYKAADLDMVIDEINATGLNLTFGIQTRIEEKIHYIANRIKAGNTYANRAIIGAQVASHPFGGEDNSGTGFKAGGPYYLMRFLNERTLTINTASIGSTVKHY